MESGQLQRGNLVKDLGKLCESHEFTDMTLLVGSRWFPAHRAVLAAHSPAGGDCEDIPNVEEEVLEELLCYIYTDRTTCTGKLMEKLLIAANKYQLPLLDRRCEEKMICEIRANNAAVLAVFASTYCCTALKRSALGHTRVYEDGVIASGIWVEAQKLSPQVVVEELAAAESVERSASEMAPQNLELSPEYKTQFSSPKNVHSLVAAGADLEARFPKNCRHTPLHAAAVEGRKEVVAYLLREGAEVDSRDEYGMTALHMAAGYGYLGTVKVLLQAAATYDARAWDGFTPLQCAAANGHVEVVRALLKVSADVNVRDGRQNTPLHCAAFWGYPEVAATLLAAGADREARDCKQKTPLDVAKQSNEHEWDHILRENP